ncbi:hypothetical protein FRX31_004996 [Thalictrum thalictroides]|uniref:Embryo surrounding factor 1 brassicaceae domain-containing protein n=1 Tax=Thalictrum thalictroides TaxID=46969 RepID=A0A7J6X721_THATH|nr:hypothetical protein FRX31_004996 [Thalictrum thalictroides]
MIKSPVIAVLFLLMFFNQFRTYVVQASSRLPLLIKPQDLQPPLYITVTGCNNNCDGACCYCDIKKHPPLCVKCCNEDP